MIWILIKVLFVWDKSELWCASIDSTVNSTFTEGNVEESLFSPWGSPWVSADPVLCIVLSDAPSNNFDGMTTKLASWCVLVDTTLVAHEIFIDSESSFHWSIVQDVWFNLISFSSLNVVCAEMSLNFTAILAFAWATWDYSCWWLIWHAWVFSSTSGLKMRPCPWKDTSIASSVPPVARN